ncbi:MAG: chitobiase/beta-hexosaminidase C-terminal domain-containing protein, partial [Verrucomicrobiota bacterium]
MKTKLLLSLALLAAAGVWRAGALDTNGDGMSDVYASHYGLSQDSAGEDEDGDGLTNLEESKWGTDPTARTDAFTGLEPHGPNVFVFSFDSVVGKKYLVEFTDDLSDGASWTGLGSVQPGNGGAIALGAQVIGDKGFWRLAYKGAVDFDGDGLSLYEENLLGTDDTKRDTDGDYILDANEYLAGTQPNVVDTPPAVTFDPAPGDYDDAQNIELRNPALPDHIYYTTDGSEPTLFSAKYDPDAPVGTGADALLEIRAKVILPDGSESAESSGTYRVGSHAETPQTVYYGWVTAAEEWDYAYGTDSFTLQPGPYTPKNYLVMGDGWIVGGEFIADTTQPAVELYYGLTGTQTGTITRYVKGYSTDSSVFHSEATARNYRPVGKGWLHSHESMQASMDADNSGTIYYAWIGFRKTASITDYLRLYTTSSLDQSGGGGNAKPITTGWITSVNSIVADTDSVASSPVYYGATPFSVDSSTLYIHLYSHHPSAFSVSGNRITLGRGWLRSATDFEEVGRPVVPDRGHPANPLHYGRRQQSIGDSNQYRAVYTEDPGQLTGAGLALGAGYIRSRLEYDVAWLTPPQTVHRGTTKDLAGFSGVSNFHVYDADDLESFPNPVEIGLGRIENNEFIEYAGSGDPEEDVDDDGLTLEEELELGTDPNYFDTDGDLIPDGFEADSAHLDPLVPDPLRGEDFDGDGLDTYEELINGSNPDLFDSDGDTVGDGEEVAYGTDPFDESSKPFDPHDFVGPDIDDPDCEPIGNLGVFTSGGGSGPGYSVSGRVGDPSWSKSERWRLLFGRNSGNRKAE